MSKVIAYVGLGSNLDEPVAQLRQAIVHLATVEKTKLVQVSPAYQTKAFGPVVQPDYVNACLSLNTSLSPFELLEALLRIETLQGRVRSERWGPRTLDLDLLMYGDLMMQTPTLTLPHPRMHERNTVLQPLLDIAPGASLPDGRRIAALLEMVGLTGITPLPVKLHPNF